MVVAGNPDQPGQWNKHLHYSEGISGLFHDHSHRLHWGDPFTLKLPFYCVFYCSGLQTYVKSQDKAFAAATIQAIGRCATNISEVTDTCLNGLVLLLSNRDGRITFWTVDSDSVSCTSPVWLCLGWILFLQRLWWLRAWWWLRSCFRLNPPSTVRSSSTWPSSLITSLYASQFLYPL